MDPPDLDGGLVGLGISPEALDQTVTVAGNPGAVDPPEGVVIITNLDRSDAPSIAPVAPDGSFAIAVPASGSEVLRLQVKGDELRSEPVDLALDATATSLAVAPVGAACLTIEPAAYLPLEDGAPGKVLLSNGCAEALQIVPPRLRRGQAGLTFSPTAALDLAPGDAAVLTVRPEGAPIEEEDVLYLEIVSGLPARRAVTIVR